MKCRVKFVYIYKSYSAFPKYDRRTESTHKDTIVRLI